MLCILFAWMVLSWELPAPCLPRGIDRYLQDHGQQLLFPAKLALLNVLSQSMDKVGAGMSRCMDERRPFLTPSLQDSQKVTYDAVQAWLSTGFWNPE
ncbi:hypothetical protein LX36DRAFT_660911 [Colletotrichum falcatum]|nr:hypothetical protein LX36DRAFT_660911 [Colletotrichum falcatum]